MGDKITRRIVWLSSLREKNQASIASLTKRLADFYLNNPDYYTDIDFTSENWINTNESGYADIINTITGQEKILEVGCGSANILKHYPLFEEKYSGCDFSPDLIKRNEQKYQKAEFKTLDLSLILPYHTAEFDLVFSVFVLEHSTNPGLFLTECVRVLKKDGILIILCPDFLGRGRMSSQRSGLSSGTTRDKFFKKHYLDALITLYDNRIKLPVYCKYFSFISQYSPMFYVNIYPTVFTDKFIPDVDAVYLTSKKEIALHLKNTMEILTNPVNIVQYEKSRKLIYLKLKKIKSKPVGILHS